MFAENLWWQALFTVQTKFPFEFFIAKTFSATWPFGAAYGFLSVFGFIFPRRKIRKKTKQHLIIHHSEIKKVIYVLFFTLHLTPERCICCLKTQKYRRSEE